jgi:hypothetical protein
VQLCEGYVQKREIIVLETQREIKKSMVALTESEFNSTTSTRKHGS